MPPHVTRDSQGNEVAVKVMNLGDAVLSGLRVDHVFGCLAKNEKSMLEQ